MSLCYNQSVTLHSCALFTLSSVQDSALYIEKFHNIYDIFQTIVKSEQCIAEDISAYFLCAINHQLFAVCMNAGNSQYKGYTIYANSSYKTVFGGNKRKILISYGESSEK